jgi:hypothetical protein
MNDHKVSPHRKSCRVLTLPMVLHAYIHSNMSGAYSEIPKSELWTPYLHRLFPPKSVVVDAATATRIEEALNASSPPRGKSANTSVRFAFPSTASEPKPMDPPVPEAPSVGVPPMLSSLKTTWDYQYRPPFATEESADTIIEGPVVSDFEALELVLDGANLIYCANANTVFGLLRAAPRRVTDLSDMTWAPYTAIDNPEVAALDPFRPKTGDLYYDRMGPHLDFPKPLRIDPEGVTRPTADIPPDPDWIPDSKHPTPAKATSAVQLFGTDSCASQYNTGDSREDIESYLRTERYLGSKHIRKTDPPYFRDARMIHWMLKTHSLAADLKIDDLCLRDLQRWNQHHTWWSHPRSQLARGVMHPPPSPECVLPDVDVYVQWQRAGKWGQIRAALEYEARLTADLFTVLHVQHNRITCQVNTWDRKAKEMVAKWENRSVLISTPAMLTGSKQTAESPPATSAATSTLSGHVLREPLAAPPSTLCGTYNVICAVAVANHHDSMVTDSWCEMTQFQEQEIAMIACMIISQRHPNGVVKFFAPRRPRPAEGTIPAKPKP